MTSYYIASSRYSIKKVVHKKTAVLKSLIVQRELKGLQTFGCPYEELPKSKKFCLQGIFRKTWKKKSIDFEIMTRCSNNVEHLQDGLLDLFSPRPPALL